MLLGRGAVEWEPVQAPPGGSHSAPCLSPGPLSSHLARSASAAVLGQELVPGTRARRSDRERKSGGYRERCPPPSPATRSPSSNVNTSSRAARAGRSLLIEDTYASFLHRANRALITAPFGQSDQCYKGHYPRRISHPRATRRGRGRPSCAPRSAAHAGAPRLPASACQRARIERSADRRGLGTRTGEDCSRLPSELHLAPAESHRSGSAAVAAARLRPADRSRAL